MSEPVAFTVNGRPVTQSGADPQLTLLDYLHEDLGLTGSKFGCGIGICRACTVLYRVATSQPWVAIPSCISPVTLFRGAEVLTIEGLSAAGGELHPVQQAFLESFAFQCGYCTSGFVMASVALVDRLARDPVPRARLDAVIADAIGRHVCRCTGYAGYHAALRKTLERIPGLLA